MTHQQTKPAGSYRAPYLIRSTWDHTDDQGTRAKLQSLDDRAFDGLDPAWYDMNTPGAFGEGTRRKKKSCAGWSSLQHWLEQAERLTKLGLRP